MKKLRDGIDWFKDISGWVIILVVLFSGCNTLKQDQKNLGIIQGRNPEILHNYCALTFPLKPSGSTFKPATNPDYTDSLDRLNKGMFELQQSNEDLRLAVQQALTAAHGDTSCQSIIRALKAKIEVNAVQMDAYKRKISDLQRAYKPCAPDTLIDTIPDLAAIQVQVDKVNALQLDNNGQLKTIASLEKSNAHKTYVIIAMGLALITITYLYIKK